MKKKVFGKKFSRSAMARKGLFRSLTRSVVVSGGMVTTSAKAKAVIPFIEKLITEAKKSNVASKRRVLAKLGNDRLTARKIYGLAELFKDQKGGYLKITPHTTRKGDNAPLMKVELTKTIQVQEGVKSDKKSKKTSKSKVVSDEKPKKKSLKDRVSGVIARSKK